MCRWCLGRGYITLRGYGIRVCPQCKGQQQLYTVDSSITDREYKVLVLRGKIRR